MKAICRWTTSGPRRPLEASEPANELPKGARDLEREPKATFG